MKSLLLTKQLEKDKYYDFGYDNQIIVHEKYDATHTYKKLRLLSGYIRHWQDNHSYREPRRQRQCENRTGGDTEKSVSIGQ